jgi:hypothetical protein
MTSLKNTLQEYCQITKGSNNDLPSYDTRQTGGEPHNPIWTSYVRVFGKRYKGKPASSKTEAENNAARMALDELRISYGKQTAPKTLIEKLNIKDQSEDDVCILLDLENKPKILPVLEISDLKDISVYIFASKNSGVLSKISSDKFEVIVVPSTRKDGADIALTMYCTKFLLEKKYSKYIIITGDHFGHSLVELIKTEELGWSKQDAIVVETVEELKKVLC